MSEEVLPPTRAPGAHLWRKGQSGNPGGRPAVVREVRELAQSYAAAAVEELARLGFNAEDERVRIAALRELLTRAVGRAEAPSQAQSNISLAQVLETLATRAGAHRDTMAALRAGADPKLIDAEPQN